jgi:hypothetical protein
MREHRDREMAEEESDLGDIVLSWSVRDIMDNDLFKGKVLDRSFGCATHGCGYPYGGCQLERFCLCLLVSLLCEEVDSWVDFYLCASCFRFSVDI